jgi:hypothetical protein
MRRLALSYAVTLLLVASAGCGGGDSTEKAEVESSQAMASMDAARHGALGQLASFEGKLGCGRCTYEKSTTCSPAVQTADGEVYMIEAGARQDELSTHRLDRPEVKISGRVSEVNGQKVIYAENVVLVE